MVLPRFSIVIPTVDRHELLEKTIAACLLSPYPNLEVLVSDNFSTPETVRVVEGFRADSRVRYVRTTRRLSMPDHWDFAWQQSTGEYIIINGDDDAFSPSLVDCLAQIVSTLKAALMSWDAGLYYHPDWNLSGRNTFVFANSHSRLLLDIDPQTVFASYSRLEIPMCFPQGTRICFSRELANRAVARVGKLFWPPYPDYSAPLLLLALLERERYIYWDALVGYGGRSLNSNAAAWDKEGAKTGSSQRATDYFEELQQEDIYPNSELKIRAYSNGHVETLNLLRTLLPEVFGRYQIDRVALIAAVECELRGIGINNPFLGPRERFTFDAFMKKTDPTIVVQAMEIVRRRKLENSIEIFRSNSDPVSWSALGVLLDPRFLSWVAVQAIRFLDMKLIRFLEVKPIRPNSTPRRTDITEDNLRLVAKHRSGKTWLDCSSFDGKDGQDLVRKFGDIVAACDRRDPRNLAEFFNKGFLVAAYELDEIVGVNNPATTAQISRL